MARQDLTGTPNKFTANNGLSYNRNNKNAKLLSRLEDLNLLNLKQPDGKYLFYLCYPNNTAFENPCLICKQDVNPLTITGNEAVSGLEIIETFLGPNQPVHFTGLRSNKQEHTFLNGMVNKWYYAIVTINFEFGEIPSEYQGYHHDSFAEFYVIY